MDVPGQNDVQYYVNYFMEENWMKRFVLPSVVALVALTSSLAIAGDLKSGLQVGDAAGAFNVKDITGPAQGQEDLCYRWRYGANPVVTIFTRSLSDSLASLVKKIDDTVAKNEDQRMRAFVVLLTDNPSTAEADLKALAEKHGITETPLTLMRNTEGPPSYKIAADADVTVMMWKGKNVKVNHAFRSGQLTAKAIEEIVSDTSKILK